MPFQLIIKDGPVLTLSSLEGSFNGEKTTIGRSESNDIALPDSRRLVSSKHAEIHHDDGAYLILDVGSKNGTSVNGQRLEHAKPYPLSRHDQIAIGEYLLEFHPLDLVSTTRGVDLDDDATLCLTPGPSTFHKAVEQLRVGYRSLMHREPQERVSLLVEMLREIVNELGPQDTERVLSYVEATFPDPEFQQERVLSSPIDIPVAPLKISQPEFLVSHDLVSSYLSGRHADLSAGERIQISKRIEAVLKVFLESLIDSVKSRRKFEEEMEVEVTRMLAREQNPIKWAQSTQEIGAYLFDVSQSEAEAEKVMQQLREALADLALHPIGVMAGFQECLRGLLKQLDPASFRAEAKGGDWSTIVSWALSPLLKNMAWDRYAKMHKTLLEEETKTVKTLLNEEFGKGYLRVYVQQQTS